MMGIYRWWTSKDHCWTLVFLHYSSLSFIVLGSLLLYTHTQTHTHTYTYTHTNTHLSFCIRRELAAMPQQQLQFYRLSNLLNWCPHNTLHSRFAYSNTYSNQTMKSPNDFLGKTNLKKLPMGFLLLSSRQLRSKQQFDDIL